MIRQIVDYIKDDEFKLEVYTDRVHIVNYQELLSLENKMIRIKTPKKRYNIKGEGLLVTRLLNREILITGHFEEIEIKYDKN